MTPILEIENISKQYRLGYIGTGSISDDIVRWWSIIRGKDDPFLKIGDENDRTLTSESDYIWALKDINLNIFEGEVVGIIGKNGAGKSTLLKILSRITTPTTGKVVARGRIASLLEVGTGFNAELTGRENIFLNGAILGMKRKEISSKFNDIVSFSGCERYIDTPVKRYSSGMYVRLAFAVAAHLEPEILIVDEVLAVGDAEFQQRAIGKMQEISRGLGKTVLFVSHNMESIERLCNRTILLKNGQTIADGKTNEIIRRYLIENSHLLSEHNFEKNQNEAIILKNAKCHNSNFDIIDTFEVTECIGITIEYEIASKTANIIPAISIKNEFGVDVFHTHDVSSSYYQTDRSSGVYVSTVFIPSNFMTEGIFTVGIALLKHEPFYIYKFCESVLRFKIKDEIKGDSARGIFNANFPGIIRPKLDWNTKLK